MLRVVSGRSHASGCSPQAAASHSQCHSRGLVCLHAQERPGCFWARQPAAGIPVHTAHQAGCCAVKPAARAMRRCTGARQSPAGAQCDSRLLLQLAGMLLRRGGSDLHASASERPHVSISWSTSCALMCIVYLYQLLYVYLYINIGLGFSFFWFRLTL